MSPHEALEAARASGVEVRLDGKDLVVSSAGEPPDDICAMLSGHKADLVEHLRAQASPTPSAPPPSPPPARPRGWSAADWRIFHNDRQAVAEIVLGQRRGQARASAYTCCIREWLRVRPGASEEQAVVALAVLGIVDPSPPPPPAVEHLQATGPEVIGLAAGDITGSADSTALRPPQGNEWSANDWQVFFDERAGVAEHDGKLARPQAKGRAYQACLGEWLDRNPVSSSPEAGCVVCGAMDRPGDGLLPVGMGTGPGRSWVHRGCSATWRASRLAEAARELAAMGIADPASNPS